MDEMNKKKRPILYIVVPCYNEQEVLPETEKELSKKLAEMINSELVSEKSRIAFVNDGSKDQTWELIETYCDKNPLVSGIKLSKNRGHQFAVLAGLMTVKDMCDIAVTMDADLQDDINVLDEFVRQYLAGCEIVYGVRNSRKTDTLFKRFTAQSFYKLMGFLGVDIIYNHADYRLMSRVALEALSEYQEVNLFLRGIVPLLGYQTGVVEYARKKRFAGESKYPLKKMLSFAFDGITSFSIKPIRAITCVGALAFVASVLMIIYVIIGALAGNTVSGWATLIISVWAFGGLILIALGIIGEYLGKAYMETKGRPRFTIEKFINGSGSENMKESNIAKRKGCQSEEKMEEEVR